MKRKIVWLVVSGLMVLALLVASCAPAVEEAAPPPSEKPAAPAEAVAPAETPAAPTGPEMVKVSLKKLDGTVVEKMVEKPRYGGKLITQWNVATPYWDHGYVLTGSVTSTASPTLDFLMQGDWARGLAGTGEVSWKVYGVVNLQYQVGDLAESWEIVPPDTLIFHIRQGVHFGLNPALEASRLVGGREVTAEDIVWNLKRAYFELKTHGSYTSVGDQARPVEVYATDKWTVVVKVPKGQIWQAIDNIGPYGVFIYAPEVGKKYGNFQDWTRAVGTGPFILTDYVAMSQVTWVRNPNYWMKDPLFPENQLPYVDTLKRLIIPDASTRMSALRTGRVDMDFTREIGWEDAASLQKTSPQLKSAKGIAGMLILGGRIDKPELPFKDIRVRRALTMAVNLQEIADTYHGGTADVFGFPLAPSVKEWEKAYTPLEELGLAPDGFDTKKIYQYNPAEAKKLLAEAGYPNGFKTEIILESGDVDLVSIVKDYWAKNLNVDLKLDVKESTILASMRRTHTYKEMSVSGGNPAISGVKLFPYRTWQTINVAMVEDPKIMAYYETLNSLETWSDEWSKVLKEANVYAVHLAMYTPLPQEYSFTFWQPWLKGYQGETAVGAMRQQFLKYVWIDQALKKALGR